MRQIDFIKMTLKWWWFILFFTTIASAATYFVVKDWPHDYQIVTKVFVSQGLNTALVNTYDTSSADRSAKTVAVLVQSDSVKAEISKKTGIPLYVINKALSVKTLTGTQLLEIKTKSQNREQIKAIAQEIVPIVQGFLEDLQQNTDEKSRITISIVENPLQPALANRYFKYEIVIIAFFLSLLIGFIFAYLFEYFDSTIEGPEDLTQMNLIHLGNFGVLKKAGNSPAAIIQKDNQITAEMLREVRTNIDFLEANNYIKSLLVTSANPKEGKSILASNLSIMFSGTGKKVIIIDADLRNPFLHKMFKIENKQGLSDFLLNPKMDLNSIILPSGFKNLYLITAGQHVAIPSEIMSVEKLKAIKEQLLAMGFNLVVFDTPPLGIITDAAIVAQAVNGAVLVAEQDKTDRKDVERIRESLHKVNATILGVVLTKVKGGKNYYGYY